MSFQNIEENQLGKWLRVSPTSRSELLASSQPPQAARRSKGLSQGVGSHTCQPKQAVDNRALISLRLQKLSLQGNDLNCKDLLWKPLELGASLDPTTWSTKEAAKEPVQVWTKAEEEEACGGHVHHRSPNAQARHYPCQVGTKGQKGKSTCQQ